MHYSMKSIKAVADNEATGFFEVNGAPKELVPGLSHSYIADKRLWEAWHGGIDDAMLFVHDLTDPCVLISVLRTSSTVVSLRR
jgi:hypothetical protein